MKFLNNWSIRKKVVLFFLGGGCASAVLLGLLLFQLRQLVDSSEHALEGGRHMADLMAREVDHLLWVRRLRDYVGGQKGSLLPHSLTGEECSLSKWLANFPREKFQGFSSEEVFRELEQAEESHGRLLQLAMSVRQLVEEGQREEAAKLMQSMVIPKSHNILNEWKKARLQLEAVVSRDRGAYRGIVERTWALSAVILLMALIWAVLAALLVGRYFAAPLRVVAEVAAKVKEGDLSARTGLRREDEVGWIAAALDAALDAFTCEITNADARAHEATRLMKLFHAVNEAARLLLLREGSQFDEAVGEALRALGEAAGVDRAYIRADKLGRDGRLYCHRLYEWSGDADPARVRRAPRRVSYEDSLPGWEKAFAEGRCVNELVRDMSPQTRALLEPLGIKTLLAAPIVMDDRVWGFICFSDCREERQWPTAEEDVLRGAGLLMAAGIRRHEMEVRLKCAKDRAEDATQAKGEFLARMSHEIRTPMNAILGITYLALQAGAAADQRDFFLKIKNAANNLLGVLNDILDFSKIEARKLELENEPFSIKDSLCSVYDILSMRAREKGIDLCLQISPYAPDALVGDSMRLRQVLLNLAGNAVKFTGWGGVCVELEALSVLESEATLHFSILDTGIGMDESSLERLFQPFMQTDSSITRRYGGTGLGLAISKELVEMMGGHMEVQSSLGEGSVFSFTLTLPRAEADRVAAPPAEAAPFEALSGKKILLAEDNDINQMIAVSLLEHAGIIVKVANNGAEAVEMAREEGFDLVLMDIQMPVMDGLEATRRIRALAESSPGLPIVAMTAHAMSSDYAKSLAAGMNDHITKPIDPGHLYAVLARWMCQ